MAAAAIVGGVSLTDMAREVLAVVCKAGEKEFVPTKYIYIKSIPTTVYVPSLKLGLLHPLLPQASVPPPPEP
jgi:hypothetical protein